MVPLPPQDSVQSSGRRLSQSSSCSSCSFLNTSLLSCINFQDSEEEESPKEENRTPEGWKQLEIIRLIVHEYNTSDRVQTSDAFWRSARVIVPYLSLKRLYFFFLVLFSSNLTHFSEIQFVCDGRADRRTGENVSKKKFMTLGWIWPFFPTRTKGEEQYITFSLRLREGERAKHPYRHKRADWTHHDWATWLFIFPIVLSTKKEAQRGRKNDAGTPNYSTL